MDVLSSEKQNIKLQPEKCEVSEKFADFEKIKRLFQLLF